MFYVAADVPATSHAIDLVSTCGLGCVPMVYVLLISLESPPIQRWYGNLGSERWRYCFNKLSIQFVVWRVHHCIKSVVVLTSFPWRFFCRMICKFSRSIVWSKQNGYIFENYNSSWYNSSSDAPNVVSMPIAGFEPVTYALRMRCSTNWAISAWTSEPLSLLIAEPDNARRLSWR